MRLMTCPACQRQNPTDAVFCSGCRERLVRVCPSCGRANTPDSSYCNSCGTALAEEAPSTTPSAHELPESYVGGRYEVKRLLGEGAKKRVYLARDTQLDRDVAFAVIKAEGLERLGR